MVTETAQSALPKRFGAFEFDPRARQIRKHGHTIRLHGQPLQILELLLEHPAEVVLRENLRAKLWPEDTFVDFEHSLNAAVNKLREALCDNANNPRFIETVPRRGYRFICPVEWIHDGDVRAPGATAENGVPNGSAPTLPAEPIAQASQDLPRPWWQHKAALALAACLCVVVVLCPWVQPRIQKLRRLSELQRLTVAPLTALPGGVASPTFSPDGSQVAFAWDGENNGAGYDLYVKVVGSDKPQRLTHHPSTRLSAAWSPDGRNIAFVRAAAIEDSGVYLVPPTGGPERKLVARSPITWPGAGISWSPDGKRLAYADQPADAASGNSLFADATLQLFGLSLETLEKTRVDTGCIAVSTPEFSPRGTYLSWVCNKAGISSSLWIVRLSGGNPTQLLKWEDGISGVAWSSDERRIVFSSFEKYGAIWEVWIDRPTQVEKLPFGHDASDLATNTARAGLACVQGTNNVNIWRLDLQASPPQARKLVTSSRRQRAPSISPDGSKIAFDSNRSGNWEVWVCDADGSNAQQLSSFGQPMTGTPRWSPDGKLIAFDSREAGESNIYIVDPNGGVPRKLSIDVQGNSLASWSRDGRWIYFMNGEDIGTPTVWKVPSSGGHAVQIAGRGAYFPLESPDGEHVYFVRGRKLWQAKSDRSTEHPVDGMPDLNSLGDEWFPSGSGIFFLAHEDDRTVIKLFDLRTKHIRPIFTLERSAPIWIGGLPVSSDGKYLLYPQVDERSSNLMMIENWR